ncbi:hypothetical protein JW992_00905 [candidate division KSB1 bacterium]|nr:hypothetical protein [candidate division KSB1 bacterium]
MEQQELILTCESCGEVIHTRIDHESQIDQILLSHQCKNKCKAEYRSYIIIGKVNLDKVKSIVKAVGT